MRKRTAPPVTQVTPVTPVTTAQAQEEEESDEEDDADYELNANMILSDAHLDILQGAKDNKSKARADKKVEEYVSSLAAVDEFSDKQKQVIARWYHRLSTLPGAAEMTAIIRAAATKVEISSEGSRLEIIQRLLKVPGLYLLAHLHL